MAKREIPVDDSQDNNTVNEENQQEQPTPTTETAGNDTETKDQVPDVEAQEEVTAEEEQVEAPQTIEEEPETKLSELERTKKELGEMKDKYLRIFAEFDNYRKRTIKERQDIIKLASRDALNALLPAVNDFERAIKATQSDDNTEQLPEGIVLVYSKLMKALEQQGIREMETDGQDFDPELHEALTKIPAPTEELKGKIIDTIEKGYYLNDKIIRHPKVVVGE